MTPSHLARTACWGLMLTLILCSSTDPGYARDEIRYSNELIGRDVPPGRRGIFENEGKHVHNVGNVLMNVTNLGILGSMPGGRQRFETAASAQWPAGSGTEYLWGGGLWFGAERAGAIAVSAWEVRDGRLLLEFLPGLGELDRIFETRELAPGGARLPAINADDDGDGHRDEERFDGRDNDGDGLIDEDYAAISDQMFYCEYRDDDPRLRVQSPEHEPLGIRVQQTTMAWGVPQLDDVIVFDFTIINESASVLSGAHLGFFADFDIGSRQNSAAGNDDVAGFWEGFREIRSGERSRIVRLSIGYMADDDGDGGQAPGYVGLMFLGGVRYKRFIAARPRSIPLPPSHVPVEMANFQAYTRFSAASSGGKPNDDVDRYAILNGTALNALPPRQPAMPLRESFVATNANDYSIVVSARGPFLAPGDTMSVQMAMVFGDGLEEMIQNAAEVQRIYEGFWFDLDRDPTTGVDGQELSVCSPHHTGFVVARRPCVEECQLDITNPECWQAVPEEGCVWSDADCDAATGAAGQETHVPWMSTETAPPSPTMRVAALENRVELLWDDSSESFQDPFFRVVDFESYQIWRADGWKRPLGTNANVGPGNDLFFLMDEYDIAGNGVGRDRDLTDIRHRPDVPDDALAFYREWVAAHPQLTAPDLPGLSRGQVDTALAMARGVRYYRYVDPPFVPNGAAGGPCPEDGSPCPPIETPHGPVPARCHRGVCTQTAAPPRSGENYFYAVTAADHQLEIRDDGTPVAIGPGVSGSPNGNFAYVVPQTRALVPEQFGRAASEIYVVPNPATPQSMAAWSLQPNNDDPSGFKVEFHHVPQAVGKISIFTLSGDLVVELPFDGRHGSGTVPWNLISRNGQDTTSGVYLFVVEADGFDTYTSRFVVVR